MFRKNLIDTFFIRKTLDSYNTNLGGELEGEDGGHGSGNWGHKGRPGLRGGSGQGGGSHYRGGNPNNYYSSKKDWLNGLSGERQHEVQKWMQTKGKTLAEQEKNVLTSGSKSDIIKMLKAKGEARGVDNNLNLGRMINNLTPDEVDALLTYTKAGTGTDYVSKVMSGAETPEEIQEAANLLNKLMGDNTGSSKPEPKPEPQPEPAPIPGPQKQDIKDISTAWFDDVSDAYSVFKNLQAMGCVDSPDDFKSNEDLAKAELKLSECDFCDSKKLRNLETYIETKSIHSDIDKDILEGKSPLGRELHDILSKYGLPAASATSADIAHAQSRLKTLGNLNEWQQYLYKKNEAMGGAKITAPLAKEPAEVVDSLKKAAADGFATTDDCIKTLKSCGIFPTDAKIDITHAAPECAKSIMLSYARAIEAYPFISGRLGGIDEGETGAFAYASCSYKVDGQLHLNGSRFANPEKLKSTYEHDLSTGFHPEGTTWEAIIDHEIGHAIDGWLWKGAIGDKKKANPWSPSWDRRDVSATVLSATAKALGLKISECKYKVSTYAAKEYPTDKTCEWFAECMAEVRTSKHPRQIALECEKQLKLLIEKRKKGID